MGSSRDERIDELLHFAASRPGAFARVECLACAPIQRDALADDRCTVLGKSRPTVRATIAGAISRTVSEAVYFSVHGRNNNCSVIRVPEHRCWDCCRGGEVRVDQVGWRRSPALGRVVRTHSVCRTPPIAAGPGSPTATQRAHERSTSGPAPMGCPPAPRQLSTIRLHGCARSAGSRAMLPVRFGQRPQHPGDCARPCWTSA